MIQNNNNISENTFEQIWQGLKPVLRTDIVLSSAVINILSLALPMVLLQVYDRLIPN